MSTSPPNPDENHLTIPADLIARADQDTARIRHEHGLFSLLKSPNVLNTQRIATATILSGTERRVAVTLSTMVSEDAWRELSAILNEPLVESERML